VFRAKDPEQIGVHRLKLEVKAGGELSNFITQTLFINVTVNPEIVIPEIEKPVNTAPYFVKELPTYDTINNYEVVNLDLVEIKDGEDDPAFVLTKVMNQEGEEVEDITIFYEKETHSLRTHPTNEGVYTVEIKLVDSRDESLFTKYTIKLKVGPGVNPDDEDEEEEEEVPEIEESLIVIDDEFLKKRLKRPEIKPSDVFANITDISNTGLIKIKTNKPVQVPLNFTNSTNSTLNVTTDYLDVWYIKNSEEVEQVYSFNVANFTSTEIDVQLEFDSLVHISQG